MGRQRAATRERARPGRSELSPGRRLLAWAWSGWEWLFGKLFRLYEVPGCEGSVVRFGFRRWRGPAAALRDGTVVRPGDWVAEVHIHSPRVLARWEQAGGETSRLVFILSVEMRTVLQKLAAELAAGRLAVPISALYGKTLLHRAAGWLGFEVHDLPSDAGSRLLSVYERWLMALYHPGGRRRAARPERIKIVWMSRQALMSRFGASPQPVSHPADRRPLPARPACYTSEGDAREGDPEEGAGP